jgi:ComF family protein
MCATCYEKIKQEGFKKTKIVGNIRVDAYFFYENEIQKLIRGIKYHNKKELAGDIAKILYETAGTEAFPNESAEIIPVPLHSTRQAKRKYNHMELIANEISSLSGCKVNTTLIKRVKDTIPQYNLSPEARRRNLESAFKVFPEEYSGKELILLDDISTTGATIEEMALELRKRNINNVLGLVIAFTGRKSGGK